MDNISCQIDTVVHPHLCQPLCLIITHLSFLKAHALTLVLEQSLDLRHVDLCHHLLLHLLHLNLLLLIVNLEGRTSTHN